MIIVLFSMQEQVHSKCMFIFMKNFMFFIPNCILISVVEGDTES